jgi:hypothetical protein
MEIRASNLLFALRVAINDQRKAEREHGFTRDSGLVAGLEDLYKHVQQGGQITIKSSQNG